MSAVRTRWAAIGAAVAISLGAGATAPHLVGATSASPDSVLVPITPCRITDTRATAPVGARSTPLGTAEVHTITARGVSGDCTIPSDAVALSLNVTAIGATQPTFLTIWAAGADRPDASSLNPSPGAPPTPNAVTTSLSSSGKFSVYNLQGSVDVIIDVNGYYTGHDHDDRYYTKSQVDSGLAAKADAADVYTAAEVDALLPAGDTFDHIVVVSGNGTPAENGAALVDAIDVVTSAGPTAASPWVILVEPGVYESTSFPALPPYVRLVGSGRSATRVVDTDDGPALTATGFVTVDDLTVEQSGTATTALFTDDVELNRVRVITGTNSTSQSGLAITGAETEARLTDIVVDDDDPTDYGTTVGISVQDGATVDLIDSEIVGIYRGLGAAVSGSAVTVDVRGTRIDTSSSAISVGSGEVTVDHSVFTDQISLGSSPYTQTVDVTVRNSAIHRIFYNGSASTAARTATVESSTMSGGFDSGAGDGLTTARVFNTHVGGGVDADTEACSGVTTTGAFHDVTCP